jgi:hypothetical protein
MPRPTPVPVRRAILSRWRAGDDAARIAEALDVPARTVRHLIRRLREHGEEALTPRYRRGPSPPDPVRGAALALRREHPRWGGPFIRSLLLRDHPAAAVPSARALQRLFRSHGLGGPPRPEVPAAPAGRAGRPHEVWQMDASEEIPLAAGGAASWLRVVDEFSGAALMTRVFPPRPVVGRPGRGDRRGAPRRVRPVGPAGAAPGR